MQHFLQFIILTFIYSSTCFGHPHAHHQELQLQWQPLVLPSERGDSIAVGRGRATDHDQQHFYHQAPTVNQRLLLQWLWLLMMGVRTPETC